LLLEYEKEAFGDGLDTLLAGVLYTDVLPAPVVAAVPVPPEVGPDGVKG
jgi:hypothetical protein